MLRRACVLLILALFVSLPCLADFTVTLPPEHPFTKNIRFVVDVSGSMIQPRLSAAINSVLTISEQPIDEMQVALVTFDDLPAVWPGIPEPDLPKPVPAKWAALPNSEVTGPDGQLAQFIRSRLREGNTWVNNCLAEAVDDRKDLTVVFITDGEFQALPNETALGRIPALQQARVNKGLEPAVIVLYCVVKQPAEYVDAMFRRLSREFGGYSGGYYIHKESESLPDNLPGSASPPGE